MFDSFWVLFGDDVWGERDSWGDCWVIVGVMFWDDVWADVWADVLDDFCRNHGCFWFSKV